jgi:hypothetical protein
MEQISLNLLKDSFLKGHVELLQKKTIQKPDKTNITSLLHVFLSKITQNGVNKFK